MFTITQRVIRNARRRGVTVYTRKRWGSLSLATYQWRRRFRRHHLLPHHPVDTVWQHITVTHETGNFKKDMRTLESVGNQRFGSGVSYNFAIDMATGEVGLGQSLDAAGTHTLNDKGVASPSGAPLSFNQNYVAIGIAFLGMPGAKVSQLAGDALVNLLEALIEEGAVTRTYDYLPHSWVAAKDCPTQNVRDIMPGVRDSSLRTKRK